MSSHILELARRIGAAAKATRDALLGRTVLIISAADRPRIFAELDDRSLAAFCRRHLIACARASEKLAAKRSIPIETVMAMHGSLALYRICHEGRWSEMTLDHEGVTWSGEDQGDWRIVITRLTQSTTLGETP